MKRLDDDRYAVDNFRSENSFQPSAHDHESLRVYRRTGRRRASSLEPTAQANFKAGKINKNKNNKRPMGHIGYLRNQFKSINIFEQSYDYITTLIK